MKTYRSYIAHYTSTLARALFITLVLATFSTTSLLAYPPSGGTDGTEIPPEGMMMPPAGMTMPPMGSGTMSKPTAMTKKPTSLDVSKTSLDKFNDEWVEILNPLKTMPVQDNGFIRSANTFARINIKQICNKPTFEGQPPLLTTLWLITHPVERKNLAIIKTTHPEFGKLYGSTMISANAYRWTDDFNHMVEMADNNPKVYNKPAQDLFDRAEFLDQIEGNFAIVPHAGEWLSPLQARAHMGSHADPKEAAVVAAWEKLKGAIIENNTEMGQNAVGSLMEAVTAAAEAQNTDLSKLKMDLFYHEFGPFMKSAILFVFAALLYGGALLFRWNWAAWGGYFLLLVGFIISMVGFVCRWLLAGRAPLSNMYESFTFAVAGLVLVTLVFEAFQRTRLAGFGGALLGAIFMIMAHSIDIFDSSIKPLMPALDSIWLTYHVIIIMLSYSAFALSFFISVVYILNYPFFGDGKISLVGIMLICYAFAIAPCVRLFVRLFASLIYILKFLKLGSNDSLSKVIKILKSRSSGVMDTPRKNLLPSLDTLDTFNYKVIAVGFPLLTIGIILGAVWANTAWGRPWGFDPKETWSLITWLIYAAYLHVRFMKGWRGLGAAIVAVIGFLAVLFTYYGVNYLLPGLHSYA